ncbi:hypothetical protein C882_0156 [Caenispirillum salinarum AK4]|uniref:Serine/threonine kinase n=1 Tax=Caenispirillum salinarum AK4 TaxID=1238182 RepID=K9GVU9_9PROT|nr:ergothioneine biosynthesis protein EgtB [Caenispirillum salinarum]EKV30075.1 hypothetical protein C882_0156 [Caenispirillum salinarum AK4]
MLDDDRTGTPAAHPAEPAHADRDSLRARYAAVRKRTEDLAARLSPEDMQVQPRTECSPTKWHIAHVTWFFETFILREVFPRRKPFHPDFPFLFNSYYWGAGPRQPRPERGLLTRPPLDDVYAYRRAIDADMDRLLAIAEPDTLAAMLPVLEIGLAHEEQHQELILMDILDLFSRNPLRPAYRPAEAAPAASGAAAALRWHEHPGGIVGIGHGAPGFAFDNEGPRHDALLRPFRIASRCVTNGEWLAFMQDGGYERPDLWLMDGWGTVQAEGWQAPEYWVRDGDGGGGWLQYGLTGTGPIDPAAPVVHISFYEADAYARWAGARLPTEEEWEAVAAGLPVEGHFLVHPARDALTPRPAPAAVGPVQMFGDVWEWTGSPYRPYPGYRPPAGTLGEYNGKFMSSQMVLRGGCCATPAGHLRPTYRNFFYPHERWAFSGVRLAEDC